MNVKKAIQGDSCTINLSGKFTFADNQTFRGVIESIKNKEANNYTLDLTGLEFVDSAALGMFLVAREEATKAGANLSLQNPNGHVEKMFSLSNFSGLFNIV